MTDIMKLLGNATSFIIVVWTMTTAAMAIFFYTKALAPTSDVAFITCFAVAMIPAVPVSVIVASFITVFKPKTKSKGKAE